MILIEVKTDNVDLGNLQDHLGGTLCTPIYPVSGVPPINFRPPLLHPTQWSGEEGTCGLDIGL